MFSPTMMASSTTMPSTRMKANSEIRLIDTSSVGISARAPRKEIGIPSDTQAASRSRRNSASTSATSAKPARPFLSSRSSRLRRMRVWSCQTVSWMPSGIRGRASAR